MKHKQQASVFFTFQVFSNVRSVLLHSNTRLSQASSFALWYRFYTRKTLKQSFSMFYLTNKEASTVLCSVVKHAGSGRARKKCRGKHETQSSVFPYFLSALQLLLQLLYLFMKRNPIIFPRIRWIIKLNFIFQRSKSGLSCVLFSDKTC